MTVQPVDRTIDGGGTVAFTAFAMAKPQPSYRWQSRDSAGLAWADLADSHEYTGIATPSLSYAGAVDAASGRQFRCVVTNSLGAIASRVATLRINGVQPIAPLASWRRHHFGTEINSGDAANTADPDADGHANLLEYALGTSPLGAERNAGPTLGMHADPEGNHLTLTFNRISDPALGYTVEASDDLASWTSVWTSVGVQNEDGTVTVSDPATVQTNVRRFLRLKVSY
jgi:hypothetical protein